VNIIVVGHLTSSVESVDCVMLKRGIALVCFLVEHKSGENYWLKIILMFAGQRDLNPRIGWNNPSWNYKKEHYPIGSQSWL
jgi:hypothetical protein